MKTFASCPEGRHKESIFSVITVCQQTLKYSKAKRFKTENSAEPGLTMSSICETDQQHEWQTEREHPHPQRQP